MLNNGTRKNPYARAVILFIGLAFLIGTFAIPTVTKASTVVCDAPTIENFTPYIYDGHLDSFNYTLDSTVGTSHLPLSVLINGEDVDLRYVSVWRNLGADRVLVHVDVPNHISLSENTVISVKNLQITQGPPPICMSGEVFHVNLPDAGHNPISTVEPVTIVPTTDTTLVDVDEVVETPEIPDAIVITDTAATTDGAMQCSLIGKWQLPFAALIDVIVSLILILFMSVIASSNLRLAAAVLVPPAIFIGFWYTLSACRSEVWFPILTIVLAIIVLTASGTPLAFEGIRNHIMQFFGKRSKNIKMKFSEATSIMEVRK